MDNKLQQHTASFWKQFLTSQIENNLDYIEENSIKNFHIKGFNYICFLFSPTLTIRLYIIEPSEPMDTSKVNIHNHLYDSQMLVLLGTITNNVYEITEDDSFQELNHYYLTSALHPDNKEKKIKLDNLGKVRLKKIESKTLTQFDTHFQVNTEIHNVFNDTTQLTAFMIWEFPTVKKNSTLYSTKDFGDTIPTPNAYQRFTREEIVGLVTTVIERI